MALHAGVRVARVSCALIFFLEFLGKCRTFIAIDFITGFVARAPEAFTSGSGSASGSASASASASGSGSVSDSGGLTIFSISIFNLDKVEIDVDKS